MQLAAKHAPTAKVFVDVELQQPVKVMVLAMSVMLQTTYVNVARRMLVCQQNIALLEAAAAVISSLHFHITPS